MKCLLSFLLLVVPFANVAAQASKPGTSRAYYNQLYNAGAFTSKDGFPNDPFVCFFDEDKGGFFIFDAIRLKEEATGRPGYLEFYNVFTDPASSKDAKHKAALKGPEIMRQEFELGYVEVIDRETFAAVQPGFSPEDEANTKLGILSLRNYDKGISAGDLSYIWNQADNAWKADLGGLRADTFINSSNIQRLRIEPATMRFKLEHTKWLSVGGTIKDSSEPPVFGTCEMIKWKE